MTDEYSLSTYEKRQKRRNLNKENRIHISLDMDMPISSENEYNDDGFSYEYFIKENTRRIKRAHEKKEKKVVIPKKVVSEEIITRSRYVEKK